jgi:anti-sigma factor ChrR (cupin superfamily)
MKHSGADNEIAEQASSYALGALTQPEARAFEEHLSRGCEVCEAELRSFENVVGALGLIAPEAEPPASVRQSLLDRISQEKAPTPPAATFDLADAQQFLTVREGEGTWQEATQGVFIKRLFVDKERRIVTSLYKLLPGAQAAPHLHAGAEQCYVLAGDFEVNDEVLGPGDFTSALAGSLHHTARTQGGTMLLIIEQAGPGVLAQL